MSRTSDATDQSHGHEPYGYLPITRPDFDSVELQMVKSCLDSGWVTQGPLSRRFEEVFQKRHNVRNAVATTSCTAALHLSAIAMGLGPSDEVIVPAFTWVTSAHCIEYVGAKVVFADIDKSTFNIDPDALQAAIGPKTRAILVVHLFGLAADLTHILEIANRENLKVIEDAACAVGSTFNGTPVGGFGDVSCFSFHPRKVITTGEGGMIATNCDNLASQLRILRNHGASGHPDFANGTAPPYLMGRFDHLGYNLRLSDVQAAIGVAQMQKLDTLLVERQSRAQRYLELLADIDEIALPHSAPQCGHTYQSFVIRIVQGGRPRRNAVMEFLDQSSIQTRPGTHAVHRLGYYARKYNIQPADFPNASLAEDTSITLPLFPGMTDDQQDRVVAALRHSLSIPRKRFAA